MNLYGNLPFAWNLAAHLLLGLVLAAAAWHAPWRRLVGNEQSHVWLGAIVATTLLWIISARVGPMLNLHLMGATLLTLMMGLPLALVALAVVAAAATVATHAPPESIAVSALVSGALPALVSRGVLHLAEKHLAPNFFVYIFIAAFFGAGAASITAGATALGLAALEGGAQAWPGREMPPLLLLIGFGEATLTGMLATLFAVYRPAWMASFDDARYLRAQAPRP